MLELRCATQPVVVGSLVKSKNGFNPPAWSSLCRGTSVEYGYSHHNLIPLPREVAESGRKAIQKASESEGMIEIKTYRGGVVVSHSHTHDIMGDTVQKLYTSFVQEHFKEGDSEYRTHRD
ncbi:hypothetical protein KP509_03G000800 [Ceratopteris richardii]|uniref:Uncharacterized protein n=1 Tax=Ceratopteris richardii TaxID=49495 RepID=A0A8T2V0T2_CERRI|nr:hypothetical protein KP509_03G000800 [Ceratopteris richardii]